MNRFTLSWEEDLSPQQFEELQQLSAARAAARRLAEEADAKYAQRLRAIAGPLIETKLSAIGATAKPGDLKSVQMVNEGFANPAPRLAITVSNEPGGHFALDAVPT